MGKTQPRKKGSKFFQLFSCFSKKSDKMPEENSDMATSPVRRPSKVDDEDTTEPRIDIGVIEKVPLDGAMSHAENSHHLPNNELSPEASTTPTEMIEETKVLHMEDPPLAQPEETEDQVKRQSDVVLSHTDTAQPVTQHIEEDEDEVCDVDDVEVEMPPSMEPIQTALLPPPTTSDTHDPSTVLNCDGGGSHCTPGSTADTATQQLENMVKQRNPGIDVSEGACLSNGPASNPEPAGQVVELDGTGPQSSAPTHSTDTEQLDVEETEEEQTKRKCSTKRKFVLNELWETEKDYVHDLGLVVNGYMEILKDETLEKPEGLANPEKQAIVFGNLHQIYEWHQETFSAEIEKCIEDPSHLGPLFIKYERRLHMYVKYCENKPKSEYIVAEYIDFFEELRAKMGHRLMLPDILIKPVQRITKYQLLLKDVLKQSEKGGEDTKDLQRAVQVMYVVPKAANDMMNVGRLQGFTGRITAQGQLQLQGTLLCKDVSAKVKPSEQKFEERRVFLFEQLIIISEELKKKKNPLAQSAYVFKNSMKVNKMTLDRTLADEDPLSFRLNDRTPGSDLKLVIQAQDQETKENWVTKIGSILEMQGDFLRALQSPIAYQKELTKELSAPEFGTSHKPSLLRKTNSHPHHYTGSVSLSSGEASKRGLCEQAGVAGVLLGRSATAESSQSTNKHPLDNRQRNADSRRSTPGAMGSSSAGGSPKSKPRNIFEGFRNTLRPKKTQAEKTSDCCVSPSVSNIDGGVSGDVGAVLVEESHNEAVFESAQPAVSS